MEIVTGATGAVHVTPIDDAVRNSNAGYTNDKVVFTYYENLSARDITANEVRVFAGYGMNQGRLFKIPRNTYDSAVIENGSQGYKRADLIVARYSMDSQTGFESMNLVVIRGQSGDNYIDPSYTEGDINAGDDLDDFPLYRVKINGLQIEAVEPLFEPLPDGGRIGEVEAQLATVKEDVQTLTNTKAPNYHASVTDTYGKGDASNYGHLKLSDAIDSTSGTADGTAATPKAVKDAKDYVLEQMGQAGYGDMMSGVYCGSNGAIIPEKGGTGQTTLQGARNAMGLGNTLGALPVACGGTGNTSVDTTPTSNSTKMVTSGGVKAAIESLQATFQAGVNAIFNAVKNAGVTPSASTPSAIATAIGNLRKTPYTETYKPTTRAHNLDMGVPHNKRYIDTTAVPNTNSGTYSFPSGDTGGTKDLGVNNTYRFVEAGNVYNAGRGQGQADKSTGYLYCRSEIIWDDPGRYVIIRITAKYNDVVDLGGYEWDLWVGDNPNAYAAINPMLGPRLVVIPIKQSYRDAVQNNGGVQHAP